MRPIEKLKHLFKRKRRPVRTQQICKGNNNVQIGAVFTKGRVISDKDVMDWLNSDLEELIDFDYGEDGKNER